MSQQSELEQDQGIGGWIGDIAASGVDAFTRIYGQVSGKKPVAGDLTAVRAATNSNNLLIMGVLILGGIWLWRRR